MKKFILPFLSLLLWIGSAHGQQITQRIRGSVKDLDTKMALPGAKTLL